jgi:hypothetical protein
VQIFETTVGAFAPKHSVARRSGELLLSAKGETGFRAACREPANGHQLAGGPGHAKNAKRARILSMTAAFLIDSLDSSAFLCDFLRPLRIRAFIHGS